MGRLIQEINMHLKVIININHSSVKSIKIDGNKETIEVKENKIKDNKPLKERKDNQVNPFDLI